MQVGEDPRPVMRAAFTAFQDGSEPDRIMAAINPMRGSHDTFYAQLVRLRSKASNKFARLIVSFHCQFELPTLTKR